MRQPAPPDEAASREIYTVSRLNREVGFLLKTRFDALWVEGELSNLARPASGHLYFSIKDRDCQLRCAMFRRENSRLAFRPENGDAVLCRGRVGLYEPRGEYQFIIEHMEQAGEGRLRREFERLKNKLAAEGLFDSGAKMELPRLPRRIGVITSPSGAAVRDIIHVLARRFPAVDVRIYPVAVQGEGAADQIVAALATAEERADCDVLLLARGGGSLEDLQAFNEESVARAVHACPIPVICGVGHEIDFSIADFAADVRAPTPSGAAELAVPDAADFERTFQERAARLAKGLRRTLSERETRCAWLAKRIAQLHPGNRLQQRAQRLDELEQRLRRGSARLLGNADSSLGQIIIRLRSTDPAPRVRLGREHTSALLARLRGAAGLQLERAGSQVELLDRALQSINPRAILGRGYAIVTAADGSVIRRAADVAPGDRLALTVAEGEIAADVVDQERS